MIHIEELNKQSLLYRFLTSQTPLSSSPHYNHHHCHNHCHYHHHHHHSNYWSAKVLSSYNFILLFLAWPNLQRDFIHTSEQMEKKDLKFMTESRSEEIMLYKRLYMSSINSSTMIANTLLKTRISLCHILCKKLSVVTHFLMSSDIVFHLSCVESTGYHTLSIFGILVSIV